jgi:uncharacterized protein (DUF952 family)
LILHITSRKEWLVAQTQGEYRAPSLDTEGFIHCSTEKQVIPVANAFYRGQNGLVVLVIDETRLKPQVKWEAPAGPAAEGISPTDQFPHVYGPINMDAVASVLDLEPDTEGIFNLPPRS